MGCKTSGGRTQLECISASISGESVVNQSSSDRVALHPGKEGPGLQEQKPC